MFTEIAEWVLNKCALSKDPQTDGSLSCSGDYYSLRETNQKEAVDVFSQKGRTESDFGGFEHMISIEGN